MGRDRSRADAMVQCGIIRADLACMAKVPFASKNDARHAAKMLAEKSKFGADIYKCPFGQSHWHITKLRHGEDQSQDMTDD